MEVFARGNPENLPSSVHRRFACEDADMPILPHFVKTVLMRVEALSWHSGLRHRVEGDGQAAVLRRTGEGDRAMPHV
jgi:hypothetical protein